MKSNDTKEQESTKMGFPSGSSVSKSEFDESNRRIKKFIGV